MAFKPRYPLMPVASSFPVLCFHSQQQLVSPRIPLFRYTRKLAPDALGDISDKMLCSLFALFELRIQCSRTHSAD